MKTVAMYLPQFHRTPENDAWWGEGFTDWVSARGAEPLFEGHYQPHIPLDHNYYDLSDADTLRWQSSLMKKYGIDALCFYHYYFEGGRKILEKPVEMLLANGDIDIPWCFCWANESWVRSWGRLAGTNAWNEKWDMQSQKVDKGNAVLLNQAYGDSGDWEKHFYDLLPFFRDERYLKMDGRPVFVIYRTGLVDCLGDMLACWDRLSAENGLQGIYYIGINPSAAQRRHIDAELYHEPARSLPYFTENQYVNHEYHVGYQEIWERILHTPLQRRKVYYGGFVSYDDTPRRGNRGIVVTDASPELFGKYLSRLMKKNEEAGNDITFINAWNEWGEGMHLEPDEQNGLAYLEQALYAKQNYQQNHGFEIYGEKEINVQEEINAHERRAEKFEMYLNDLSRWMSLKETGGTLFRYFERRNIQSVAIYGYGIMGRHLLEEIKGRIAVCVVDKQCGKLDCPVPAYVPEEMPRVDLVVVASYYFMDEILEELNTGCAMVSLGDIIRWAWNG